MSLLPCGVPLRPDPGVRIVPLVDPTPLYSWSLIWRRDERHPLLEPLLTAFANVGRLLGRLKYDPAVHWMPDRDS